MESRLQKTNEKSGVIIGKFMPPHRGHQYLIDFARAYVDKLTVLVCSTPSEPVPGDLRYQWIKETFPDVNVRNVMEDIPQEPKDSPYFWPAWSTLIRRELPEGADYLFASESYGTPLANSLGMKYIPVDKMRNSIQVSGTLVRSNPIKHWEHIMPAARLYFLKRICIFGPESTGKTVMAEKLAKEFDTVQVAEYARGLLDLKGGECNYEDIEYIAKGQTASEDALARQANRVIFTDTDLLMTTIWSDILFGKCPGWVEKKADNRKYDLYLLLNDDVLFTPDSQRYGGDRRQLSTERCIQELERRNRKYVLIDGLGWNERLNKATKAVKNILYGDKNES